MEVEAVAPVGQVNRVAVSPQQGAPDHSRNPDLSFVRVWAQPSSRQDPRPTGFASPREYLEQRLRALDAKLVFRVDEESGKLIAEVRDYVTGELVRQIPPEEMIRISKAISEYLGLLIDERR